MTDSPDIEQQEIQNRVLFSLLTPAVRMAAHFGVPIRDVTQIVQLAYFRQLRSDGHTLQSASDQMDVSVRTAKRLSQRMKENFFAPELEHELPRQIEFMLWGHPMSRARILQVSGKDEGEVDAAIEQLEREERVRLEDGRTPTYHVTRSVTRLVRDGWVPRIGGLNALMNNVTQTVLGRFFKRDDAAFARTISFKILPSQVPDLQTFYETGLLEKLKELETTAGDDPDKIELQLSLLWAPYDDVPEGENK